VSVPFRLDFPFVPLPHAAEAAFARSAIDETDLAILVVLWRGADWRTRKVTRTLAQIAARIRWGPTDDALSKRLHKLRRAGWFELETTPGKHAAPYLFTLNHEPEPSSERSEDVRRSKPHGDRVNDEPSPQRARRRPAAVPRSEDAASPHRQSDSAPTGRAPVRRTSEPQRETKALSEEDALGPASARDHDHVVGETTGRHTDALLIAATENLNGERDLDDLHDAIERAREASDVGTGCDLDAIWPGPPLEGEEGVLADLEALVEAGLGEWVEEVRP
jgi:hypothetical protein